MCQNRQYTFNGHSLAQIDFCNSASGDRRCYDAAIRHVGRLELTCILRCSGDLGMAIDTRRRDTDIGRHDISPYRFVRLRLRRAECRLRQSANDCASRQADLERVVLEAFCVAEQKVSGVHKNFLGCRLASQ